MDKGLFDSLKFRVDELICAHKIKAKGASSDIYRLIYAQEEKSLRVSLWGYLIGIYHKLPFMRGPFETGSPIELKELVLEKTMALSTTLAMREVLKQANIDSLAEFCDDSVLVAKVINNELGYAIFVLVFEHAIEEFHKIQKFREDMDGRANDYSEMLKELNSRFKDDFEGAMRHVSLKSKSSGHPGQISAIVLAFANFAHDNFFSKGMKVEIRGFDFLLSRSEEASNQGKKTIN